MERNKLVKEKRNVKKKKNENEMGKMSNALRPLGRMTFTKRQTSHRQ